MIASTLAFPLKQIAQLHPLNVKHSQGIRVTNASGGQRRPSLNRHVHRSILLTSFKFPLPIRVVSLFFEYLCTRHIKHSKSNAMCMGTCVWTRSNELLEVLKVQLPKSISIFITNETKICCFLVDHRSTFFNPQLHVIENFQCNCVRDLKFTFKRI